MLCMTDASVDLPTTPPPTTTTVTTTTVTTTTVTIPTTTTEPEPVPGKNLPKMPCISSSGRKKRSTEPNQNGISCFETYKKAKI